MSIQLLDKLLVTALVWVAGCFLVHELYSLDVWWHLVIGKDILQTLQIPEINLYSAAAMHQPYHDSHWLFQAALAVVHAVAGLNGPILLMLLVWGGALYVVYRETRAQTNAALAVFATFLVVGASTERFLPRPEIITFLMIALFYALLRRSRYQTPAQIFLLVGLQVIWTNSHGLFVIGPFMAGCYWLEQAITFARGKANSFKQLSMVLPLLCLGMLISPHGSDAVKYSFLLFSEVGSSAPAHMQSVNELSPTFGQAAMGAPAFWYFFALLSIFLVSVLTGWKQLSIPRLLIVAALMVAALTGRRNMALFALVAAPFVSEHLFPVFTHLRIKPVIEKTLRAGLLTILIAWSVYPVTGAYYFDMRIPARTGLGVTPDFFPHELPEFIRRNDIRAQVYNTDSLGGFYLYHFYPDQVPFIDGRWEVYGEPFFQAKSIALKSFEAWKRWVAQYDIRAALLHHASPESAMLAPALYADPDWALVYYDFAVAYFVRNDSLGHATPIVFSPGSQLLSGKVRAASRLDLNGFYRNMGLKRLLLANLEELAAGNIGGVNKQSLILEMGKINTDLDRLDEAEQDFLRLLELDEHHPGALSELSFVYYQKKQFDRSLFYIKKAINGSPDDTSVQLNYCLVLIALNRDTEALDVVNSILANDPVNSQALDLKRRLQIIRSSVDTES